MACNSLLAAMDGLWYHRLILFHPSDPISVHEPVSGESFSSSYDSYQSSSCTSITEQDHVLSDQSLLTPQQSMGSELEEREKIIEVLKKIRPSRLNRIKTRSNPSSPTSTPPKASRNKKYTGSVRRLQKTMSCKSLGELEVEEVKGFMDLGFKFDPQNLSPRMMSVVPGLQRLAGSQNSEIIQKETIDHVLATNKLDDQEVACAGNEMKSESGEVRRPYLSEAWLIRRPDSPLLKLKISRNSEAGDIKKHLKQWARTVATVVQQDS
ncbi:uncharacterized protein LOC141708969 [Apium graveolens]|uniref:uncharacterized protein LOC141708969 n=1 Tax=Apium graveolens TaxID=4045 RepID=UPI003D7B5E55